MNYAFILKKSSDILFVKCSITICEETFLLSNIPRCNVICMINKGKSMMQCISQE